MAKRPSFADLQRLGFHFHVPGGIPPRGWIDPREIEILAQDAALVTIPNSAVPAELLAYYDPRAIDVVTRPRKAREIFSEVQKGDWTTPYAKFRVNELTGSTQPYADYGQSRTSGVNYNWLTRQQYVFQTLIEYGDLEEAVSAAARIQLAADKQRAAAHAIDEDANLFYLLGVSGMEIYGILNNPDLLPAIAPINVGSGTPVLEWTGKNTQQIYNDVLALFEQLTIQGDGWIDQSTPLTLVISPAASVFLGRATDYNVSVQDMLGKFFKSLKIVTLPELADETSGQSMLLIADSMAGNPVGELAYSDKIRAGRIVPDVSSFRQKWTSTTYGAIIYYPFAVATMTGIL
ncbi:MAG: DUF2184 domain-containing protein [Desulfovibrio sp.]|jgi:hypothetical protein|nr:DUF2184 domain-containing protein [Desulfovibrio sp.]